MDYLVSKLLNEANLLYRFGNTNKKKKKKKKKKLYHYQLFVKIMSHILPNQPREMFI
jgi:hypothetical protein